MPTSPAAILIIVVLIFPGWAYTSWRDRWEPSAKRTSLGELVDVLQVSAIVWAALTLGSVWASTGAIGDVPSVPEIVIGLSRDDLDVDDVEQLLPWAYPYVITAIVLAAAYGAIRHPPIEENRQHHHNGWRFAFKGLPFRDAEKEGAKWIRVTVFMTDRRVWVRGWLVDFPGEPDELENRDLVLSGPIETTAEDSDVWEQLEDSHVVLNDRDFSMMRVNYRRLHPLESPSPDQAA